MPSIDNTTSVLQGDIIYISQDLFDMYWRAPQQSTSSSSSMSSSATNRKQGYGYEYEYAQYGDDIQKNKFQNNFEPRVLQSAPGRRKPASP